MIKTFTYEVFDDLESDLLVLESERDAKEMRQKQQYNKEKNECLKQKLIIMDLLIRLNNLRCNDKGIGLLGEKIDLDSELEKIKINFIYSRSLKYSHSIIRVHDNNLTIFKNTSFNTYYIVENFKIDTNTYDLTNLKNELLIYISKNFKHIRE